LSWCRDPGWRWHIEKVDQSDGAIVGDRAVGLELGVGVGAGDAVGIPYVGFGVGDFVE